MTALETFIQFSLHQIKCLKIILLLSTSSSIWHQRLAHPNNQTLNSLFSSSLLACNKHDMHTLCNACQLGKQNKLSFSHFDSIVTAPFDIIHSDLWTSPVQSLSGIKYYVILLDQFSHFLWVYPLRHKSEVFSKFLHFFAYVKNQFSKCIKSLQCDNGGEYDNAEFHKHFATHGIKFRFSCPYTSQQNGRSERMLQTINNAVRTLLFQANLPSSFWVEALHTVVYLLNILPSKAIQNHTPYTTLFKKPPIYSHLKTLIWLPLLPQPEQLHKTQALSSVISLYLSGLSHRPQRISML